jgi:hypothetical protein
MSNIGPSAPRDPHRDQLEYLKGMAQAPMGWPGQLPPTKTIDPEELRRMLERKPAPPSDRPWYLSRNLWVAVVLTAALAVVVVWLI